MRLAAVAGITACGAGAITCLALALLAGSASPASDRTGGHGFAFDPPAVVEEPPSRAAIAGRTTSWLGAVSWLSVIEPALTATSPVVDSGAMRRGDDLTRSGDTFDRLHRESNVFPRVFLERVPEDLPRVESRELRKQVFIKMMLPLLLAENERILADRRRAIELRQRASSGQPPDLRERVWLERLARNYEIDAEDWDELIARVDIIPPSLAVAQAALESGWGTSRAALRGHSTFGHMTFRAVGESTIGHVRAFRDLAEAVNAYTHNLNTHRAYAALRAKRMAMRERDTTPDGLELARHLERYSERRRDYVRDLRGIIRANNLAPLDHARFAG